VDKKTVESVDVIITERHPEKMCSKFPTIDCKFFGRRHPRNNNLYPAYGLKCQNCVGKPFCIQVQNKGNKTKSNRQTNPPGRNRR